MMNAIDGARVNRFLFIVGECLIAVLAFNLLLCSTGFVLGICINKVTLLASALVAWIVVHFINRLSLAESILTLLSVAFIIVFASYVCGLLYDPSWDGNDYHKMAVGLLKHGWNPMQNPENLCQSLGLSYDPVWIVHYCKQSWFFGASIYALTDNIECGKAYTIIAICSTWAITFAASSQARTNNLLVRILFSTAAALNPIAISQFITFYIDGYLHLVLWILIMGLYLDYVDCDFATSHSRLLLVASAMVVVGNIKFTGLVFGGAYCALFFILFYIKQTKQLSNGNRSVIIRNRFIYFFMLAIITVFWAGMQTYPTNMLSKGNPFWPLAGSDSIDIMTNNTPPQFIGKNQYSNLFTSLFSEMSNYAQNTPDAPPLAPRIPLMLTTNDVLMMQSSCDTRISGFGAFYSTVLVVSLILLVGICIEAVRRNATDGMHLLLALILTSVFFCCVIKESWWARYTPYLWYIPLYSSMACLNFRGFPEICSGTRFIKYLATGCLALLILNSYQMLSFSRNVFSSSRSIERSFRKLPQDDLLQIEFGPYEGIAFNFIDHNCRYVSVVDCEDGERFFYNKIRLTTAESI